MSEFINTVDDISSGNPDRRIRANRVKKLQERLSSEIVIIDGAMGTEIQSYELDEEAFDVLQTFKNFADTRFGGTTAKRRILDEAAVR